MSTLQDSIRRHRKTGHGRKAIWVTLGVVALIALVWFVAPGAGQGLGDRRPSQRRESDHNDRVAETIHELRADASWLERTGITPDQASRIATLLENATSAFEDLEMRQAALTQRAASALGASVYDATEMNVLKADTERLALSAIDTMFAFTTEVAGILTAEQRAQLLQHWEAR